MSSIESERARLQRMARRVLRDDLGIVTYLDLIAFLSCSAIVAGMAWAMTHPDEFYALVHGFVRAALA